MKSLSEFKEEIEAKLDIKGTLEIDGSKIKPSSKLDKKVIKEKQLDDLFSFHNNKLIFTNRMMTLVGNMTNRELLTGHYFFELRSKE